MKILTNMARMAVLALLVMAAQISFAQQSTNPQEQQKYRIKLVKDENGKHEVMDKTFDSKAEMEAYAAENKMDVPEMTELLALPAKDCDNPAHANCDNCKMKKIIIIESDQGGNGHTSLDINYENFNATERAQFIQNIINEKGPDPHVMVEIRKEHQMNWADENSAQNAEPNRPPSAINEPAEASANLNDVKVFPNPSTGQFHIEFNVGKTADVQVQLLDLGGKEIYAETFSNYSGKFEKNISTVGLSSGSYILNVKAGNEKRTTQVVMQ